MANPNKLVKPKNALTIFKFVRAVLIGFVLFSVVVLEPVIEMHAKALMLKAQHARDPAEKAKVYKDKKGNVITADEYAVEDGYDMAAQRKLSTHRACLESFKSLRLVGCHKYVTEHKGLPPHVVQGNFGSGKSSAQCRTEVERYWAAIVRDEQEKNGPAAKPAFVRQDWAPELKSCDNYDRVRMADNVTEPLFRLDAILKKLDGGGSVSPKDRETVRADTATVMDFPDNAQRQEYLYKVEKFNLYADHQP
jgi:hypothetical protein